MPPPPPQDLHPNLSCALHYPNMHSRGMQECKGRVATQSSDVRLISRLAPCNGQRPICQHRTHAHSLLGYREARL